MPIHLTAYWTKFWLPACRTAGERLALACISRIVSRNLGGISRKKMLYEICEG
jgi:hypothetical protein